MSAMQKYDELVQAINENRQQLQKKYDLIRQLTSQKSENESVKKEFQC